MPRLTKTFRLHLIFLDSADDEEKATRKWLIDRTTRKILFTPLLAAVLVFTNLGRKSHIICVQPLKFFFFKKKSSRDSSQPLYRRVHFFLSFSISVIPYQCFLIQIGLYWSEFLFLLFLPLCSSTATSLLHIQHFGFSSFRLECFYSRCNFTPDTNNSTGKMIILVFCKLERFVLVCNRSFRNNVSVTAVYSEDNNNSNRW